jgi:hypothetical protein
MNNEEEDDNTSEIEDEDQMQSSLKLSRNSNLMTEDQIITGHYRVKITLKIQQPLLKKYLKNTEQPKTI